MWAELILLRPLFPGKTESEQFDLICRIIGTPSETTWRDIHELPNATTMLMSCFVNAGNIRTSFQGSTIPAYYVDIFERLLCADPAKRSSARLALGHRFFMQSMEKGGEEEVLRIDQNASFHEYQTKKRKYDALRMNRESVIVKPPSVVERR